MLLASCGSTTSTTTSTRQPQLQQLQQRVTTTTASGGTVLTVTEGSQVKTYTMSDLQALPSVSGNGGYMGKGGSITGPFPYQGVALTTLLNAVGGISEGEIITLTSSDNYSQQLTYDQITSGSMLNYYDTTGNPITPSPIPTLTIIYSENGAVLDSTHGPTELGALALASPNVLTDGSLWAKMVVSITVTSAATATTTTMTNTATTTTATSTTTTMAVATTSAPPVVVSTTPAATTPVILTVVNGSLKTTFSLATVAAITSGCSRNQPALANQTQFPVLIRTWAFKSRHYSLQLADLHPAILLLSPGRTAIQKHSHMQQWKTVRGLPLRIIMVIR